MVSWDGITTWMEGQTLGLYIISVILPPLAVYFKKRIGAEFVISIFLTILGWIPGILYALYVVYTNQ